MKDSKPKKENKFIDEVVLTFSDKKSFLSSKKIERFIVFNIFLVLSVFYILKNIDKLEPRDFIEITLIWLMYGGYNSFMNMRDKKLDRYKTPTEDEENETES